MTMQYAITATGYRAVGTDTTAADLNEGETLVSVLPAHLLTEPVKSVIAAKRYERETAGLLVNGVAVLTDRVTQMKLTGAALRAHQDSGFTVDWKLSNGSFTTLTAAQIISLANAVADYVQDCYTREAVLVAAVSNGTYTDAMLADGWPANS